MGEFQGAMFIEMEDCVVVSVNILDELQELARQGMIHQDVQQQTNEIVQDNEHNEEIDRR